MHCDCCDKLLTPQESVRRFALSNTFTNTCTQCLRQINVPTKEGHGYHDKNVLDDTYTEDDEDDDYSDDDDDADFLDEYASR